MCVSDTKTHICLFVNECKPLYYYINKKHCQQMQFNFESNTRVISTSFRKISPPTTSRLLIMLEVIDPRNANNN